MVGFGQRHFELYVALCHRSASAVELGPLLEMRRVMTVLVVAFIRGIKGVT